MPTYQFQTKSIPGVVVSDDRAANASACIGAGRHVNSIWGGVMDVSIAGSLKPWAEPTQLGFTSYKVGNNEWQELEPGQRIWGCLLHGSGYQTVVFALIDHGWPVVGKRRG